VFETVAEDSVASRTVSRNSARKSNRLFISRGSFGQVQQSPDPRQQSDNAITRDENALFSMRRTTELSAICTR